MACQGSSDPDDNHLCTLVSQQEHCSHPEGGQDTSPREAQPEPSQRRALDHGSHISVHQMLILLLTTTILRINGTRSLVEIEYQMCKQESSVKSVVLFCFSISRKFSGKFLCLCWGS